MSYEAILKPMKRIFFRIIVKLLAREKIAVAAFNNPDRAGLFEMILKIKKENEMLLTMNEAIQIYLGVKATRKIDGNIAEVGVYRGGSAKIISEAKENKKLFLFDTFQGLPAVSKEDQFHEGQYPFPMEKVANYLNKYPDVYLIQGLFPQTGERIKNMHFSFVHLDVDLYKSTLDCLNFFYPRMSKGGLIVSHDYLAKGVKKAFKEFFIDKPEAIIELPERQCLVVKL